MICVSRFHCFLHFLYFWFMTLLSFFFFFFLVCFYIRPWRASKNTDVQPSPCDSVLKALHVFHICLCFHTLTCFPTCFKSSDGALVIFFSNPSSLHCLSWFLSSLFRATGSWSGNSGGWGASKEVWCMEEGKFQRHARSCCSIPLNCL